MNRSRVTAAWFAAVSNPLALLGPVAGFAASLAGSLPARAADVQFTERVILHSSGNVRSVFATDLDGDGDIDVLAASFRENEIWWFENNGGSPPSFSRRVISFNVDGSPISVFATDVDGDGNTDVLCAWTGDRKIAWYENDGGLPPTFTERVISTTAYPAESVFATDVDGDGDIDVLSASITEDKIAWYESDGGLPPTFTERVITEDPDGPFGLAQEGFADGAVSVFATDVDGDGDTDVLSASFLDDKIAWYENDGGLPPTFTERVISTTAKTAWSVFATDVDGDGDIDVLSASFDDNKIAWYENDGGLPPTFTERVISTSARGARSVFATDVDGDGDIDVLSASEDGSTELAWYESDGGLPPTFTVRVISSDLDDPWSVFATDLDGDGDTDVLSVSGSRAGRIAWFENTTCGDGLVEGAEECDDGLGNSDTEPDACRTDCTAPSCGDGVIDTGAGEECEDENLDDGDGCSSACTVENGFLCTGQPSVCVPDCNGNEIPDQSDIDAGTSLDCNGNEIPDECDIENGASEDCNGNEIPDECDIDAGTSLDCNENGTPDECESGCETDTAEGVGQDETVTLNPGGGSTDLKEEAQVVFTNQSGAASAAEAGAGGATITVNETTDPVHSDAIGLETLAATLLIDASLSDGEFFMTVIVPFQAADLGGADPLDVGLVSYDADSDSWIPAVCGNTTPLPICPATPFSTRHVEQAPDDPEPTLGDLSVRNLGEHGIYWNGAEGFVWANVDHTTAFSPGFPFSVLPSLEAADDGLGADYNRVGDFKMPTSGVVGLEVAIRVKLNRMYIDANKEPNGCPVRQGLTDLSVFEGQVRYLGPPEVFDNNALSEPKWVGAKLQCAPLVRDWSASALASELGISQAEADTIYYYGAEVVPCSIHDVQQATQSCLDSANDDCFSAPLEVRTNLWGDVWPAFGNQNFTDISKVVDAFKSIPFVPGDPPSGAPNKWRSMLRKNSPPFNKTINFTDVSRARDAFHTVGYGEIGPVEICDDGIDNNCDGVIDEDGALCEGCQFGGTRCECSEGVCVNTLISRTFRAP